MDKWKRGNAATQTATAAAWYPELSTTTAQIEQIVKELLPLVQDEKATKQPAVPEPKEEPLRQPRDPRPRTATASGTPAQGSGS